MFFIKYLLLLIVSPSEGWKDIGKFSIQNGLLLIKLFHPSLAILSVSLFSPYLIGYENNSLNNVLIGAMLDFVKYFTAFYVISYLITMIYKTQFKSVNEINALNNFIVYNLVILVMFNVLRNLMPGFTFFDIFPVYIIYVIYKGVNYLSIPQNRILGFVSITALFMIIIPNGIKFVLSILIPNI